MTSNIANIDNINSDDDSCSSLDGYESPHHKQYKLDRKSQYLCQRKRSMKRKCDSESISVGGTQADGMEQGHEWNEQFGFNVERPAKVEYEWLKEKINVASALSFSLTPAASQLICKGRSYKEVIEIFVRRAGEIDEDGNGTIEVAWWQAKCAPGLAGRRYSGYRGKLPDWIPNRENTDKGFVGLSTFALPKLLRNVLRCGTGLEDIDLVACHFQMQLRRYEDLPCTRRAVYDKQNVLSEISETQWGDGGDDPKIMLISILYGHPAPRNAGEFVLEFEAEQRRINEMDKKRYPQIFKACGNRRNPEATMEYYLNQHEERKCLDIVTNLANRYRVKVNAYEFDGVTGCGMSRLMDAAAREGLVVSMKPMPHTIESLIQTARDKHPNHNWNVTQELDWRQYIQIVRDDVMARALRSLRPREHLDHIAFATIVVPLLSGHFAIEREDKEALTLQYFCCKRRLWIRGGGARHLRQHVSEILRRHVIIKTDRGADEPPTLFGNRDFINSITEEVKTNLPLSSELGPLDGNNTRGLVMFSDGLLLDLSTGKLRQGEATDRISKSTGYGYQALTNTGVCDLIDKATHKFCTFWDDGGVTFETGECDEVLEALKQGSPLYQFVYGLFENDDLTVWLILQTIRALGGLAFEEFLYMSNSKGQNGKGTWIALLMKLLGTTPANYFQTLEFSKHFIGTAKAGNNPEIAECEGKRVICVNETSDMQQKDRVLNVELIKQLCAGLDAPITAMGKYRDPSLFNPQGLLCFFAQDAPRFPQSDGGIRSRLSFLHMPLEFVPNPTEPWQRQLKTGVKESVGDLVSEVIYWGSRLMPALIKAQGRCRTVLPRPSKVMEDTDGRYMATCDQPLQKDPKTVAMEFADDHLMEWDRSMGRPSSRKQIHERFTLLPQHSNLSAIEVLRTILFDCCDNKQCRVKGCAEYPETLVYKGVFSNGLLGRGNNLTGVKVVTLKGESRE